MTDHEEKALAEAIRPRLIIAAPYVALWLVVVAGYPGLRGDPLLWLYGAVEGLSGLLVVGCVAWRRPRLTLATLCALALTSASLATTLLPALQGPAMVAGWPVVVTVWCVALAVVLGVQCRELLQ